MGGNPCLNTGKNNWECLTRQNGWPTMLTCDPCECNRKEEMDNTLKDECKDCRALHPTLLTWTGQKCMTKVEVMENLQALKEVIDQSKQHLLNQIQNMIDWGHWFADGDPCFRPRYFEPYPIFLCITEITEENIATLLHQDYRTSGLQYCNHRRSVCGFRPLGDFYEGW